MNPRPMLALVLLLAMSCAEPTRPHREPAHLFQAYANTTVDSIQSYCGIDGAFPAQLLSRPPWVGRTTFRLSRWVATTHGVLASRGTDVAVSFTVSQDSNALVFTFGPPLNDTLTGSVLHGGMDMTSGTWTCPATLPFSDDQLLLSKGYHVAPTPSGTWSLFWARPVD